MVMRKHQRYFPVYKPQSGAVGYSAGCGGALRVQRGCC